MNESKNNRDLQRRLEFAQGRERMDLILSADDPEALVAEIEGTDLYVMIKEIGELDSFELFEIAQPEQVQGMMDLECWHKDCQHPAMTRKWIAMLMQLEDEKFMDNLQHLDLSFLLLFLMSHMRVHKLDDIQSDVLESPRTLLKTPDDRYLVEYLEDNERVNSLVNRFLLRVYRLDLEFFYKLLEGTYFELASNLEEEAYQEKVGRLADRGFPEYYDAIEVYSPVNLENYKPEDRVAGLYNSQEGSAPAYPMRVSNRDSLLARTLEEEAGSQDKAFHEELSWDLAFLSNKVLVADTVDFSAGENIRDALQRVQSTLNIGLEYMSGGSVTQARKLLRSHHAKDIFRLGFSILVSYARRTRTALRSIELHQEIATLDLVDSPQREILLGLLGDRPQWYEGQTEGGRHRYREFRDLQDIKRLELSLSRLEGIFAVMRGLAGDDYTPVHDDDIAGTNHADPGGLTLSTLFCTALANLLLSERFGIRPLKRSDLTLLGERLQSEGEAEGHNREVRREFMTYTAAACPDLTAAQLERAEEVVLQYLDSLAEELALAGNGDRADLRYLKSLIVSY